MKREEFKIIAAILMSNYVNFDISQKEQLELWYNCLEDLEYKIATKCIEKIMYEREYPPTIATIRKYYNQVKNNSKISKVDVMNLITKAISVFGHYRTIWALEWLKQEDYYTYKVVKAIGFRELCGSDLNFSRSIITKMYDEVVSRQEKVNMLPAKFAKEIRQIQVNGLVSGGGGEDVV